jgi:type II secretory pathway pseudopilin PulG
MKLNLIRLRLTIRTAFSLIEMLLALTVMVTLSVAIVAFVRLPRSKAIGQACELNRSQLQLLADEYERINGRWPSSNLRELSTRQYTVPSCPVDGRPYSIDRNGMVQSHGHTNP